MKKSAEERCDSVWGGKRNPHDPHARKKYLTMESRRKRGQKTAVLYGMRDGARVEEVSDFFATMGEEECFEKNTAAYKEGYIAGFAAIAETLHEG